MFPSLAQEQEESCRAEPRGWPDPEPQGLGCLARQVFLVWVPSCWVEEPPTSLARPVVSRSILSGLVTLGGQSAAGSRLPVWPDRSAHSLFRLVERPPAAGEPSLFPLF